MTETSAICNDKSDDDLNALFNQCEKLFRSGDTAYVEERYIDAIELYSSALQDAVGAVVEAATHHVGKKLIHLQFQCYLHRSLAYQQKEQNSLASTDVGNALQLYHEFSSSISFDAHQINLCYRQYGIITYQLQKYADAQTIFEKILLEKLYNPNDTKYYDAFYQNYVLQCQVLSKQQPLLQQQKNEPIPMDITPSATITSSLSTAPPNSKTNDSKVTPATILLLTPKYQYYQNDTQMVIQILEPNVLPAIMTIQYIDTQNIFVSIEKQGHSITVIHGELYDAILPDKCSVSYKSDKVVIKLRKERPNYEWQTLLSPSNKSKNKKSSTVLVVPATSKTETPADVVVNVTKPVSVIEDETNIKDTTTVEGTVSSKTKIPKPYSSHRDWDAIEKDVEEEIAKEKPVGDEAMNQLFQQIYANADEDTKRAMIKSYQTSGGTVLSTNWNEVAQKDYEQERTAPDGQEWKTWEGQPLSKK